MNSKLYPVPAEGPCRIQRQRAKGWRMPRGAVYVGRPTKWGNPFRAVRDGGMWVVVDDNGVDYESFYHRPNALRDCVRLFSEVDVAYGLLLDRVDIAELRGRDLVCWCPLDQPCHADVLLELANGGSR